jgi:hypothetical protein
MGCKDIVELLSEYLDHALPDLEHEAIRTHLNGCRACRHEYQSLRRTVHLLHCLPEISAPPNFLAVLEKRLETEMSWQRKLVVALDRGLSILPLRGLSMAASLILVMTIFMVSRNWSPSHNTGNLASVTPNVFAGGTDPIPGEWASTNPASTSLGMIINSPTELLSNIIANDPEWNKYPVYAHPRGDGVIINTPDYVIEVLMDPYEFPQIQAQLELNGASLPRTLREAMTRYPLYVRHLPSPTRPTAVTP